MNRLNTKQLHSAVSEYTQRSTIRGISLFLTDMGMYVVGIAGVILVENLAIKVLCSVIAGFNISTLFVIAHDAAHASLTNHKLLNKLLARLAFLPCYHNYSLWLLAHNKAHHSRTNVQGENSWSPLSKQQYDALPAWRRLVERFYRTPWGICFNYLVERWWKDKFFPYKRLVRKNKIVYWLDFILASGFMVMFLLLLFKSGMSQSHTTVMEMIFLGFILPLMISSFMIGFTVYQQHTHEGIPWFRTRQDRDKFVSVEDVTMCVKYPHWYNLLSHNTMEHTVHHIDSTIPSYNLPQAQAKIAELLGDDLVIINFSLKSFLVTMQRCKLYDYDNHRWLNFDGVPMTAAGLPDIENKYLRRV